MKEKSNPCADRARETARSRYEAKVLMWKMFALCAFMAGIATGVSGLREYQGRGWRKDGPPPPITKVQVQTYGFLDKDGVWRSYDTGEKITVTNWKP